MAGEISRPGLKQIELLSLGKRVPAVMGLLIVLETTAEIRRFAGRKRRDRGDETLIPKGGDLRDAEPLRHQQST